MKKLDLWSIVFGAIIAVCSCYLLLAKVSVQRKNAPSETEREKIQED